MKRNGLLAGIMTLAVLGGCVLAVDASESKREATAASRRQTVRLLEEKLGYLEEVEKKLREGLAAARESSMTTDSQKRDMEARLLERSLRHLRPLLRAWTSLADWVDRRKGARLEGDG